MDPPSGVRPSAAKPGERDPILLHPLRDPRSGDAVGLVVDDRQLAILLEEEVDEAVEQPALDRGADRD